MKMIDFFNNGGKRKEVAQASGLAMIRGLAKPQEAVIETTDEELSPIPTRVEPIKEVDVAEPTNTTLSFLREVEGFETTAYVPEEDGKALGTSGVTVASGFDLGAHNVSDLKGFGFDDAMVKRLSPYLGKKKVAAQEILKNRPLSLTPEEANTVNKLVKQAKYSEVVDKFNRESDIAWEELPSEWQTAISSVAFQYGELSSATPNFWQQVVGGDFPAAYRNLRKFGDKYKTRRNKEADLVQEYVAWTPAGTDTRVAGTGEFIVIDEGDV